MSITTGSHIQVSIVCQYTGSQFMNVWNYRVTGTLTPISPENMGEAWWNHVKAGYRALVTSDNANVFRSVKVAELDIDPAAIGEFPIPTAESAGTRSGTGLGNAMPNLVSTGVRLTVGSNLTRPGQKRIGFLTEGDSSGQYAEAAWMTLVTNLMELAAQSMTLGAPAALVELVPEVRGESLPDAPGVRYQDVTGFAVNSLITSQVSRRVGRGS